nr:MAG TPA: hypothetical protein [Caudoviricetes sp.]
MFSKSISKLYIWLQRYKTNFKQKTNLFKTFICKN